MKRSEMVEQLAEHMFESFQGEQTFRKLADNCIKFLEEAGMVPPPYTCVNSSIGSCMLYEWEEE